MSVKETTPSITSSTLLPQFVKVNWGFVAHREAVLHGEAKYAESDSSRVNLVIFWTSVKSNVNWTLSKSTYFISRAWHIAIYFNSTSFPHHMPFHTYLKDSISGIISKGFAMFMELVLVFSPKIWATTPCVWSFHSTEKAVKSTRVKQHRYDSGQVWNSCFSLYWGVFWVGRQMLKNNNTRQVSEHLLLQSWMLPGLHLRNNFGKKHRS